ncbi:hypothetical protein IW249_005513 [Micromonospora vinacea]|uniref:DUF3732 domain-containing protein n=1 Tax=Micromonospora vinacea TaxID=709878 RepID=A0ABS0KAV4_9ACTN|nr:DUF3732 domain-containing protein [Micromonospora vinacea]MBG6105099.1 hypothetical protein [Micromonospora vinacea]
MNLLAIVLYNRAGQKRVVPLNPGELNIITGVSATGKSSLLEIVEFCMGRNDIAIPIGPVSDTVAWYAVLLQLPSTRAFVGRPAPRPGHASTQQAMLEFGGDLQPPDFGDLTINADSATVREQVGQLIGIGENLHILHASAQEGTLVANLGHALLMCLQSQSEIGNRDRLFHRQDEIWIRQALRETLPYFLGADRGDQAFKHRQLEAARRKMARLEADLVTAEKLYSDVDVDLRALLTEAHLKGLVSTAEASGRDSALDALAAALESPPTDGASADNGGDGRPDLEQQCDDLRVQLRTLGEQRALLADHEHRSLEYQAAVRSGVGRLESLELMRPDDRIGADTCPLCGSGLAEPDPEISDLQRTLVDLREQLGAAETAQPRRMAALSELDRRSDNVRLELRRLDAVLAGVRAAEATVGAQRSRREDQAFTKGRIDFYLTRLRLFGDDDTLNALRVNAELTRQDIERLIDELDPEEEQRQVNSRLLSIEADITRWARRLGLAHSDNGIHLDIKNLEVVIGTEKGIVPLSRIGSAESWIGYHVVTHLALHRYFILQGRPVPHFLMLDQPTQAYYPSDIEEKEGESSNDRDAVIRLFELMRDVIAELTPQMQIIVCDHANLPEPWFQDAVRQNWRRSSALIPSEWIDALTLDQ